MTVLIDELIQEALLRQIGIQPKRLTEYKFAEPRSEDAGKLTNLLRNHLRELQATEEVLEAVTKVHRDIEHKLQLRIQELEAESALLAAANGYVQR